MATQIKYWIPSASFTLYGEDMPKYKWLMSTYKIYLSAWGAYIPLYIETTRGLGFWLCIKHYRAVLNMVGTVFAKFMTTPTIKQKESDNA